MSQNNKAFSSEINWIASGLLLLLFIGYLADIPWLFFSLGLLVYISWNLFQLNRLVKWLANSSLELPPESIGIWGAIFRHLYRIQRHNRHRHEKLVVLLNRYKKSTEALPDAAVILGHNWEIEWFNAKTEKYLGLKKPQDINQPLPNLIRDPTLLGFLQGKRAGPLEIQSPDDHSISLSIRLIPYGDKHLLIARNITRLLQLEEIRKDFVANVSHELKTPLTVISGYLETLSDELKDKYYAVSMKLMRQQADRMCSIVDDLLLLSRIEGSEKRALLDQQVDVPALIMMLKKEASVLSDGKHQITVEVDHRTKWLSAVEKELRSAFTNLISNAILYTPVNGKINIRWYRDHNQNACFEVSDSGEGIARYHLARLTERFYRVDVGRSRTAGGTGLGLAIVKHVLNHHKARLEIESQPGKGSTFRCIFPAERVTY
jgi:two-component system phosphate regulon sensor histidine kinase PhoR